MTVANGTNFSFHPVHVSSHAWMYNTRVWCCYWTRAGQVFTLWKPMAAVSTGCSREITRIMVVKPSPWLLHRSSWARALSRPDKRVSRQWASRLMLTMVCHDIAGHRSSERICKDIFIPRLYNKQQSWGCLSNLEISKRYRAVFVFFKGSLWSGD